jgi:CheY-like chemotaxis protein
MARILIADDAADSALSLSKLIEAMSHETKVVYDGGAAVGAIERFDPQVAILDIRMPALDGYEVAELVRRRRSASDLLLIAMSGNVGESDRGRAIQAGFDHYLVKPVEPEVLRHLLP